MDSVNKTVVAVVNVTFKKVAARSAGPRGLAITQLDHQLPRLLKIG